MSGDSVGGDMRRIVDIVTRWSSAINVFLVTGLLGVLVFFYGNIPAEIAALRTDLRLLTYQVTQTREQLQETNQQLRGLPDLKERVSVIEQQIGSHEKRVDQLERTIYGVPRK